MSTVFIILLVILLIIVGIILFINIGVRFALFTASTFIDIIKSPASLFLIMCFIVVAILALIINQKSARDSSYAPSNDIPVTTEYKRSLPENKRTHFNTSETNTPTRETQEEPIYVDETPEFNTSETNTPTRETQEKPILIEETPEHKPIMDFIEEVPNTGVVYDAQGNEYKTVKIGSQLWMAENLNLKTSGSWCYGNKPSNCKKYGRLYTWKAAMENCPDGWHLPSDDEWEELKNFVDAHNGDEGVGTSLKSTTGWKKEYTMPLGSDRFGFSGKPSGFKSQAPIDPEDLPEFRDIGSYTVFWSSTTVKHNDGGFGFYGWQLSSSNESLSRGGIWTDEVNPVSTAYYVRCVKQL